MPGLVIHPKYAPSGKARVWLGIHGIDAAPPLEWRVNDAIAAAKAIRAIEPVLPDAWKPGDRAKVFTGVYEFDAPAGAVCGIRVRAGAETGSIQYPVLPAALPSGKDDWFNILLVSCFHHAESLSGGLAAALREAKQGAGGFGGAVKQLHLSLLMGDQVYLDLPTLKDFPNDARLLAQQFNRDYQTNWFPGQGTSVAGVGVYANALAAAPSVCLADDHEYWNNFPFHSPFIGNTSSQAGRKRWRDAAQRCFDVYQGPCEDSANGVTEIDLSPVHILVADSRTQRAPGYQAFGDTDPDLAFFQGFAHHVAAWVDRVNQANGFGVILTGQSLLDPKEGWFGRNVADATLPNFTDYPRIMQEIQRLKNDFLLLTGDVHFGRATKLTSPNAPRCGYEVIISPSAQVSTIGSDQLKRVKDWFKDLFGPPDPWPRHGEGKDAPERIGAFLRAEPISLHGNTRRQVGDHVGVLACNVERLPAKTKLHLKVRYVPAHADSKVRAAGATEVTLHLETRP